VEPGSETQKLRKGLETLTVLKVPSEVAGARESRSTNRRARLLSALCIVGFVNSAAFAQPEVIRCLAPEVPITDLPEAVLSEYRAEIAAEFEAYFAAVSTHIACLDTERSRALSEARMATEAYSAFLNFPPAQKDLP
jgi:hypothetical protein